MMSKAATIQARIESRLKDEADVILKKIGMTASQAINAFYAQIIMQNGLPFELKIPNELTQKAMDELEAGHGKRFASFKNMMIDLDQ